VRPSDAVAYKRMLIRLAKETIAAHFDGDLNRIDPPREDEGDGWPELALELSHYLPQCPTYFVTADMTAVAKVAGPPLPTENLGEDALPSPTGYMIFDAPVAVVKFADQDLPVSGVTWESFETTAHSYSLGDDRSACICPEGDEEDYDPACPFVGPMDYVRIAPLCLLKGQMIPIGAYEWIFGDAEGLEDPFVTCNDAPDLDSGKPLIATWVLMQQSITQAETTRPDRHQRRMCARQEIPAELVIVRLRRIEHPTSHDDDNPVPWSHRWLVGGHWRQQFYPSDRTNRPIWINPYVKGPESKPLVVKEKVTAWVR